MRKAALGALPIALGIHAERPAAAQSETAMFLTGNALLRYCTGNNSDRAICIGYVAGVADSTSTSPILVGPPIYCVPAGASMVQVKDVAVAYLQKTPELRHLSASELVGTALNAAFPCKR